MRIATVGRVLLAALACLPATAALAGGPIYVYDYVNRVPYAWNLASWPDGRVPIYTDLGPLGRLSNDKANELVAKAASQWSNVPTSTFRTAIAGDFLDIALADIDSVNIDAVIGDWNGGGIDVVFDSDGSILADYFGVPPTSVLGITDIEFAAADSPEVLEAWMVLSGPGVRANDPEGRGFAGVVTHEMGHALNLAHTQNNGATLPSTFSDPAQPTGCGAPWTGGPDDAQSETMYPYINPVPGSTGESMATVDRLDDQAALSDLYPARGWPASRGTIRGQILDSVGNQVIGVNVIARNISDPFQDSTSYISGQVSKGEAGPDGSFVLNGLTPGASYVVYTDQLMNGAFSLPRPIVLPGLEEYYNGPFESGDGSTDDRCAWTPVTATAGSPVTFDITFNKYEGAPTLITAPYDSFQSVPFDITSDGSVVVGAAGLGGPIFRWDLNADTFDLIGGYQAGQCGISDDGSKIAANVVDTDGISKAAIYENGAWTVLPPVPGAVTCDQSGDGFPTYTDAYGISGDGSTVVGMSYGAQGCGSSTIRGFKWTASGGTVALPKFDAFSRSSRANAVNYDGSVIVGWDDANNGQRRGVQWRNSAPSLIRRNNLPVGEATSVSSNGQHIVGQSNSASTNRNQWLWSQSGVQILGGLQGEDSSVSGAVNDDGSVITGQSLDFEAGNISPTIWTSGLGLINFNQFLSSQGVVTTGLGMRLGMAMSGDGRTITGYANGPYGYVGWVLKTPTVVVCHSSQDTPPVIETLAVAFPQGLNEHLGHGDTLGPCACLDADGDGFTTCAADCNDHDPAAHPGAADTSCNGVDDDCNGIVDDATVPSGRPMLSIATEAGDTRLSWDAVSGAAAYDVFAGDLKELQANAGDYASMSRGGCLGNDLAATSVSVGSEPLAPGAGRFFLVRAVGCGGAGTYDEGVTNQSGSRDAGIQASPEACP